MAEPGVRVEAMQTDALKRALGIGEGKSVEFAAILKRYKERQAGLERRYRQAIAELENAVNGSSRQRMAKSVQQVEMAMDGLRQLNADKWKALKKLLTVKQQARYLIYQAALQRALKRRVIEGLANSSRDSAGASTSPAGRK